jgi:5-oxoprolinase (ATP-hydrolysing)
MGGTSTDVSRYAGQYEQVFETTTAGVTIQALSLLALLVQKYK